MAPAPPDQRQERMSATRAAGPPAGVLGPAGQGEPGGSDAFSIAQDVTLRLMVGTGKRAGVLAALLSDTGLRVIPKRPVAPRFESLPSPLRDDVLDLYRALGGRSERPALRPGAWDLALLSGAVVELDEELHFNRYRALTLERPWSGRLPWRDDYLAMCRGHEQECVRAGSWGKRWTNPSCEVMFGPSGPAGDIGAGAPRWKQRALYDAIKDAQAAAGAGPPLVRLAVHDTVGGTTLGAALEGRAAADPDALRGLVERRSA